MTTSRSRVGQLRLEITRDEPLPSRYSEMPAMFQRWGLHLEPVECVWIVAYDGMMHTRTVVEIARGSHMRANFHLPTLLAAVITSGCERFILVHNHPNNNVNPSAGDKVMTTQVMNAANTVGLYLEDHVILTPNGNDYSFTNQGLLVPVDYIEHSGASQS